MPPDRTKPQQDLKAARIDHCVAALVRLLAEQSVREVHTLNTSKETSDAGNPQTESQDDR